MKRQIQLASVAVLVLFAINACKEGEKIETIGNHTITTKEYERYYEGYVEKTARMANAEKKTLIRFICNPDDIQRTRPELQQVLTMLNPEFNYKQYREMRIIEQRAIQEGFTDRPMVKEILEQVRLDALSKLYMMDKVEENIKISEEQKEARCQQIRQQYGPQAASMTLDDCLSYAEATLKQEIMQREFEAIREEMRERITVDTNENFDKEAFLKSGIPAYNEMRKAGNCYDESMSTTPATEEKPEE
ncbi:MAG: hypothetical protein CMN76_08045 [Spirochaetaceae bacterium]|nr:hypothetical protein [Spirochaetaceae bacterium]|tara:strand:- start:12094 stop:12834 length:741 start_codon:yes stop_codon:yes gene_type:complete